MRIALLANPGSGRGDDTPEVLGGLRRHGATVRRFSVDEPEAALATGPERLVVASGDGSIGRVAAAVADAGVPLAVVPSGTANDFARSLGIPRQREAAVRLAATGTRTRRIDLAHTSARPFVNAASAGLSVGATERASRLKALLGPVAYSAGAVAAAATARPVAVRVRCDGREVFAGLAWQVTVANTGAFGGGSEVEAADPADGLLDVVVVEAGSRARLVPVAYGLRAGDLVGRPGVRHDRGAAIRVERAGDGALNVDGDPVERAGPDFTLQPGALEVVVP